MGKARGRPGARPEPALAPRARIFRRSSSGQRPIRAGMRIALCPCLNGEREVEPIFWRSPTGARIGDPSRIATHNGVGSHADTVSPGEIFRITGISLSFVKDCRPKRFSNSRYFPHLAHESRVKRGRYRIESLSIAFHPYRSAGLPMRVLGRRRKRCPFHRQHHALHIRDYPRFC